MKFSKGMVDFDNVPESSGEKLELIDHIEQIHDDIIERSNLKNPHEWRINYRLFYGIKSAYCEITLSSGIEKEIDYIHHVSISDENYALGTHIDNRLLRKNLIRTTIPNFRTLDKQRWNKILDAFPTRDRLNFSFKDIVSGPVKHVSSIIVMYKADIDDVGHEYQIYEANNSFILVLVVDGINEALYPIPLHQPFFSGDDPFDPVEDRLLSMIPMFDDPNFTALLNPIKDVNKYDLPPTDQMIGKFSNSHLTLYRSRINMFPELKNYCGKFPERQINAKRR